MSACNFQHLDHWREDDFSLLVASKADAAETTFGANSLQNGQQFAPNKRAMDTYFVLSKASGMDA